MALADAAPFVSREEYLRAERTSPVRHEWVAGAVYAMTGASKNHNDVVANIVAAVVPAARVRGCRVGTGDLLVETVSANYYPDVVVSCEPSDDEYVERRPCFLVEVSSPTTVAIDRREKRLAYGTIVSLVDYWMVDYESRIVEVWHRGPGGWERADYVGQRSVPVTCLGIEIALADIVAGVTTRYS